MDTTQGDGIGVVEEDAPGGVAVLSADSIWKDAAEQLRSELKIGNFSAWFGHSKAVGLDGRTFVLGVASPFAKEWIEGHYLDQLRTVISTCAGTELDVVLLADETFAPGELEGHAAEIELTPSGEETEVPKADFVDEARFHPKYNFDSFVIGSSNRFAHAAALAVAETPAQSYNPLFIYGHAGLGKTHLLHAIAHYVHQIYPAYRVRYVTTEAFLNDFVDAIRTNTGTEFKRRYRETDVLLVDDIQFMEGKEGLQEEFFHTFNSLHQANRQVVI